MAHLKKKGEKEADIKYYQWLRQTGNVQKRKLKI